MFKKILVIAVTIILAATGFWYFSIKKYDYKVSFKTHNIVGEVYQKLLYYKNGGFDDLEVVEKYPFKKIVQQGKINNSPIEFTWHFLKKNDSVTIVETGVNHLEKPLLDRVKLLFGTTTTQQEVAKELTRFQTSLNKDSELYEVEIIGKTTTPPATCACIALENEVDKKAFDMMKHIHILSNYIMINDLEMTARPRVQVNSWDLKTNNIGYDFCFPVKPGSIGKLHPLITIKIFPVREALKAIYNGNYMSSHLTWVRLLDYAEKNNLEVEKQPLEIFNNNPEMGGNARNWEAEIYFPLK